ncbi:hypothetical protein AB7M22_001671 [Pseudomonas sp. ADAK2 TE3594]
MVLCVSAIQGAEKDYKFHRKSRVGERFRRLCRNREVLLEKHAHIGMEDFHLQVVRLTTIVIRTAPVTALAQCLAHHKKRRPRAPEIHLNRGSQVKPFFFRGVQRW